MRKIIALFPIVLLTMSCSLIMQNNKPTQNIVNINITNQHWPQAIVDVCTDSSYKECRSIRTEFGSSQIEDISKYLRGGSNTLWIKVRESRGPSRSWILGAVMINHGVINTVKVDIPQDITQTFVSVFVE